MIFYITPILGSLFVCLALIFSAARLPWLSRRNDLRAIQSSHIKQVSRLGGVGIILGAVLTIPLLPPEARHLAILLFLSVLPIFGAGLVEDLGYGVSPKGRLLAAALSSVLAIGLTGTWIRSAGVPGIDAALGLLPLGLALTVLWTSGLCHATNLIDGMNGLAASFCTLAALGLAALAHGAGDLAMARIALLMVFAILGFLALNWPRGHIFLGDAGAYSLGHLLSWIGIMIAWRNPDVAGAAVALVFFWPIADTLFAIYRRRKAGKRFDQPDRMHVHQIVMRWLEIAGLTRRRRYISNPLTTVVLAPFMALPMLAAIVLAAHGLEALLAFAVFGAGFVTIYALGAAWARSRRNPVNVIRPAQIVPVGEPLAPAPVPGADTACLVLQPTPDIRLIRRSRTAHWQAFVQGPHGNWHKLEQVFPSSDRAFRNARRVRFRGRIGGTPQYRMFSQSA